MPVNKGRMGLFIAALRSGEYTQGQGTLHDTKHNTWCCLGVASDVAIKFGCPVTRGMLEGEEAVPLDRETFGAERTTSVLAKEVREWYGLDPEDPHSVNPILVTSSEVTESAISMNDTGALQRGEYGYLVRSPAGFDVIADAFEKTFMEYPTSVGPKNDEDENAS